MYEHECMKSMPYIIITRIKEMIHAQKTTTEYYLKGILCALLPLACKHFDNPMWILQCQSKLYMLYYTHTNTVAHTNTEAQMLYYTHIQSHTHTHTRSHTQTQMHTQTQRHTCYIILTYNHRHTHAIFHSHNHRHTHILDHTHKHRRTHKHRHTQTQTHTQTLVQCDDWCLK